MNTFILLWTYLVCYELIYSVMNVFILLWTYLFCYEGIYSVMNGFILQVVEDGYEFFAKRQLVTLFSAPNYCGEFDNAGGMMSVDETLMCSFQVFRKFIIFLFIQLFTYFFKSFSSFL